MPALWVGICLLQTTALAYYTHVPVRVGVYVDGFNLYYGALKKRPECRWLDIKTLCEKHLIKNGQTLAFIKYFTATVKSRPANPDQPKRQAEYIRALKTIPNLTVIKGQYQERPRWIYLVEHWLDGECKPKLDPNGEKIPYILRDANGDRVEYACVMKSEEKGSDVNIGSHMLMDAFRDQYDIALLFTNDSDLITPVNMVKSMNKPVGIICGHSTPSFQLAQIASFRHHLTKADLLSSQFPDHMLDNKGQSITRPFNWKSRDPS